MPGTYRQYNMLKDDPSIQAAFERFHAEHPDIYDEFKQIACQIYVTHKHYGASAIFEVIRYQRITSAQGGKPFKLNNNFRSRYVRMLIEEIPAMAEFFELRQLRSA